LITKYIKNQKKSIFDYLITAGSNGFNRLFALLISVAIARILSAEDFGLYSLFFGMFILIFQAQAGVNIAYVRFTRASEISESQALRLTLYFQIFLLISLSLLGWPVSCLISSLLNLGDSSAIYLGIISSALLGLYSVRFGILQATSSFVYLGLATMLFNFCVLLVMGVALAAGRSIDLQDIFYTYIIVALLLGTGSFVFLWNRSEATDNLAVARSFYKMIGLNVSITLLYFIYRYIDVYFIKYYHDLETVGIYSAAMKTSMLLTILTGSLATILLPKAVTAIKSREALIAYIKKSYMLSGAIVFSFMVFAFLAPWILLLLFGNEYAAAVDILVWLVIGWIFNTLYIPIAQIFYALNKPGTRLIIEAIKIAVAVLAFIILIPVYGGKGAAYALLLAILIALFISIPVCYRQVKTHFMEQSSTA
jgi:O-antigen/teichoic acid export membrane protein